MPDQEIPKGYITAIAHKTSASVDWVGRLVTLSARCGKCKVMKEDDWTLREFFDELGITLDDCKEAFKKVQE